MKTIAKQYFETIAAARKAKPRSKRRTILTERAKHLFVRQLKIESRRSA